MEVDTEPFNWLAATPVVCPEPIDAMDFEWTPVPMDVDVYPLTGPLDDSPPDIIMGDAEIDDLTDLWSMMEISNEMDVDAAPLWQPAAPFKAAPFHALPQIVVSFHD